MLLGCLGLGRGGISHQRKKKTIFVNARLNERWNLTKPVPPVNYLRCNDDRDKFIWDFIGAFPFDFVILEPLAASGHFSEHTLIVCSLVKLLKLVSQLTPIAGRA